MAVDASGRCRVRRGLRLLLHDVDFKLDDFWNVVRDGAVVHASVVTGHLVDAQNLADSVTGIVVSDRVVLQVVLEEDVVADLQQLYVVGLVVVVLHAPHQLEQAKEFQIQSKFNMK